MVQVGIGRMPSCDRTGETQENRFRKSAHLPGCGLNAVVCSPSIAWKKSVKAFGVSALGVSFEEDPSGIAGTGVDGAYAGSTM